MTSGGLTPEARARVEIDAQLAQAGWSVQDRTAIDLVNHQGVAVREVVMAAGAGRADYILYINRRIVGVIEAKPAGTTLSEVHWQSRRYSQGLTQDQQIAALKQNGELPFIFEASGTETYFTNLYDPEPRARRLFNFPKPDALRKTMDLAEAKPEAATWRCAVRTMPSFDGYDLRPASLRSSQAIEKSLAEGKFSKSLVQMATGAGKTRMAVTEAYRLLTFGGFNRILFLVDRNNLGDQTLREFRDWDAPGAGRKFTDLYNVDKLTNAGMVGSSSVVISTIQRVWSVLKGQNVTEDDDQGIDGFVPDAPVEVVYNEVLPPESFDLIIVDECHRSIYGLWRGVLEYFDSFVVGLTATPTKQTLGFFQQNLVSEYTFAESVADKVNVDFEVYRIKTEISEHGARIDAQTIVPVMNLKTREQRLTQLDEEVEYKKKELDRSVMSTNQIRTVLETFRDRLFTEIFPKRSVVPKTLIFAKDDNHAEEIVRQVKEVFGKGNDFAAKITYNSKDPKKLLQEFRNSSTLRIAVTVDMIATGTDVKAIECVFFMRDVRSGTYFEQMKGRGARSMDDASFSAITPDAKHKERFVIVDAVGVTEHDFVEATPLERSKGLSLKQIFEKAATFTISQDETASLASRLSRLSRELTPAENDEIAALAGRPLQEISQQLIRIADPNALAAVVENAPKDSSGEPQIQKAMRTFIDELVTPIAGNAALRIRLLEIRTSHELVIDDVSVDSVLAGTGGVVDTSKARNIVESWKKYLEENRNEISAIELLYSKPQGVAITFKEIQELANRIQRPHPTWTPEVLWAAYEAIEPSKVKKSKVHTVSDLVSLVRYTLGVVPELVPFSEVVEERYAGWLLTQRQKGAVFSESQKWWLDKIKDAICTGVSFEPDSLDQAPFTDKGGTDGFIQTVPNASSVLLELNSVLAA